MVAQTPLSSIRLHQAWLLGSRKRGRFSARQVVSDRAGHPLKGVDVLRQAVPAAIEGGVGALARLEELRADVSSTTSKSVCSLIPLAVIKSARSKSA